MSTRWLLGLLTLGYAVSALVMSYDHDQTWWYSSTVEHSVQHPGGVYAAYVAACLRYFFGHAVWCALAGGVFLLVVRRRGITGAEFGVYGIQVLFLICFSALLLTAGPWHLHGGYVGYHIHVLLRMIFAHHVVAQGIGIVLGMIVLWCGILAYVREAVYTCFRLVRRGAQIGGGLSVRKKTVTRQTPAGGLRGGEPVVTDRSPQKDKQQRHILKKVCSQAVTQDRSVLLAQCRHKAQILHEKLLQFGVDGKVVAISVGPVVVWYEYQPEQHVPLSKITARESDLALALEVRSVRIVAPIPGKGLVGFECAHDERSLIPFAQGIDALQRQSDVQRIPLLFGVTPLEEPVVVDIADLPHLLVAGSTGSGKSVALHSMMISIIGTRSPAEVRCILIDPKRLEFTLYTAVPHLLVPIIHDAQQAIGALRWLVAEMDRRYKVLAEAGYKDCSSYREHHDDMPFIVVIIDEFADLMITGGKDVELLIVRIAQMARAAGIHLILATQRPSVDVMTGLIKVNIPARVALRVASKIDSRTIIDRPGAEQLLGRGDMLFMGLDGIPKRMHGLYITHDEMQAVVEHVCSQWPTEHIDMSIPARDRIQVSPEDALLFQEVVSFVRSVDEISISFLQRKFKIGYNRSARMIDYLEAHGIILPSDGGKMRRVVR